MARHIEPFKENILFTATMAEVFDSVNALRRLNPQERVLWVSQASQHVAIPKPVRVNGVKPRKTEIFNCNCNFRFTARESAIFEAVKALKRLDPKERSIWVHQASQHLAIPEPAQ